jgi:hypothetical protein
MDKRIIDKLFFVILKSERRIFVGAYKNFGSQSVLSRHDRLPYHVHSIAEWWICVVPKTDKRFQDYYVEVDANKGRKDFPGGQYIDHSPIIACKLCFPTSPYNESRGGIIPPREGYCH